MASPNDQRLEDARANHDALRAQLVNAEAALRFDHARRPSRDEAPACDVVEKLKQEEALSIWDAKAVGMDVFPGMPWRYGKERAKQTKLFRLIKAMPKGALLHAHCDAVLDASTLISLAAGQPDLYMRSSRPLDAGFLALNLHHPDPGAAAIDFRGMPPRPSPESVAASVSLNEAAYGGEWVRVSAAREGWPGGAGAFDAWLRDQLTIEGFYGDPTVSVDRIWHKFRSTFSVVRGLFLYQLIMEEYFGAMFKECYEDGIMYLEPRLLFWAEFGVSADGEPNFDHAAWVDAFCRSLHRFKTTMLPPEDAEVFDAKIIYSTLRLCPNGDGDGEEKGLRWWMNDCLALKQQFPDIICGFDIVGCEDDGHPLSYFLDDFLWLKAKAADLGLDLPLILHAGETLADGGPTDSNLYDAILLGTKRIGHGFSLVKHPVLMQEVKSRGICIESCPISNEVLRYTDSSAMHPLPILLNYGVPVALSSDDPAMFGNSGLTHDFYQALIASNKMNFSSLIQLAVQSIEHSRMSQEAKARSLKHYEAQLAVFCRQLLQGWPDTAVEN